MTSIDDLTRFYHMQYAAIEALDFMSVKTREDLDLDNDRMLTLAVVEDLEIIGKDNMSLQLIIDYPETLPDALQQSKEQFEQEAKWAMAVKLFEMKRLSSGMAAALIGIDRVSFLINLHRYDVTISDLTEEELLSDLENA